MRRALPIRVARTISETLRSGMRIGDYIIERELPSSDRNGVAYLGTHVVLPRQAALKVMHGGMQYLRSVAVQMLREACLLEAIAHPAVPRVYECGVLPDRRPWTAFEHVEGSSVAELISSAPMPLADLVVILRDTADLLQYAHARAIVHRGLTAHAILSTPGRTTSTVCVRHWDEALTLDSEARVRVDASDDLHALGVIAYSALVGELPTRHVTASQRCRAAPAELTALVDRMLALDPAARPSAAEVRDRAGWLASTVAPLTLAHARWTPPRGLAPEKLPSLHDDDPAPGDFAIRIIRPRSS